MTMASLLSTLNSTSHSEEICYLQSQNGNVYNPEGEGTDEFDVLRKDVEFEVGWCSEALGTFLSKF